MPWVDNAPVSKTVIVRRPRQKTSSGSKLTPAQRKEVKKIVSHDLEDKYSNVIVPQTSLLTTANIVALTHGIVQGVGDNQRVGDKIKLGKMYLRLFWGPGDSENFMRFILFQWKPSDLAYVPTVADILLPGPGGVQNIGSQYNHDRRSQFKILYDKTMNLIGDGAAPETSYTSLTRGFSVDTITPKLNSIQFEAATFNGMNHVYMLGLSDSNVIPHPYIYFSLKIMYTDA